MTERRKYRWPVHYSCQERRFRQRDILDVFIEKRLRRLPEALDIEGTVLAEADLVDIDRKNLFFREAMLEHQRDHHLGELAKRAAPVRQKKRPRHLHRQRGT